MIVPNICKYCKNSYYALICEKCKNLYFYEKLLSMRYYFDINDIDKNTINELFNLYWDYDLEKWYTTNYKTYSILKKKYKCLGKLREDLIIHKMNNFFIKDNNKKRKLHKKFIDNKENNKPYFLMFETTETSY